VFTLLYCSIISIAVTCFLYIFFLCAIKEKKLRFVSYSIVVFQKILPTIVKSISSKNEKLMQNLTKQNKFKKQHNSTCAMINHNIFFKEILKIKNFFLIFLAIATSINALAQTNTNTPEATYSLLSLVDPGVNTLVDGAMVAFKPNYSNNVDFDDALKLSNTSENVSYKRNGFLLAIERRKTIAIDDTLFINLTGLRVHKYQWDINVSNMVAAGRSACLIDNFLNQAHVLDLNAINKFQFDVTTVPATYASNRFMIVFKHVQASPMTFVNITAERKANKTVQVKWSVASELNMASYTVERSIDGINFVSVATQIATANNGGTSAYSVNDATAPTTKLWYRVKSSSMANVSLTSTTITINAQEKEIDAKFTIYPNPVLNGNVNVQFVNQPQGEYTIIISGVNGQLINTQKVKITTTNLTHSMHINNLASGRYQATIINAIGEKNTIMFLAK
jgi:hypothetical protein